MAAAYAQIGKVGKAYGTDGAVKLKVEEPYLNSALESTVLFIPLAGKPAPFFVEEYLSDQPPIVKLEDIDNKEEALPLCGQPLFLREEDLQEEQAEEEEEDYSAMIGYTIHEEDEGEVGEIRDIAELPEQILAVVDYEGREVLIPINEHFIRSFDPDRKIIVMQLPEGLLDL